MPVDVIYTINRRGNRFHRTDEYAGLYRHNGSLRRLYGQDYKRRGHEGHIKRGDGSGKKGPQTGDLYNGSYKAFCLRMSFGLGVEVGLYGFERDLGRCAKEGRRSYRLIRAPYSLI